MFVAKCPGRVVMFCFFGCRVPWVRCRLLRSFWIGSGTQHVCSSRGRVSENQRTHFDLHRGGENYYFHFPGYFLGWLIHFWRDEQRATLGLIFWIRISSPFVILGSNGEIAHVSTPMTCSRIGLVDRENREPLEAEILNLLNITVLEKKRIK